ncbi:MAG TPA: hypothetical protein DEA62_00640, partial [Coxiellaceae bacterium]|nr:hypothetical protein [Coxiellaceae bacterium]
MNFEVASPYGLHVGQVELDMAYIQSLSSQLLKELTNALNVYHKTSYGLRYWHIILGNWLKNYIRVIYNRYFTLEQAMANYTISRTAVFNYENYSLASYDCASFNRMSNESVWNNIIYGKILYFWNYKDVDFLAYPGQTLANLTSRCNVSFGHRVKQLVINIWNNVFHRKQDAFIINSYLPKKEELKLQLLLKQIPQ